MFKSLQTHSRFSSVGFSGKALCNEHQHVQARSTALGMSSAFRGGWLAWTPPCVRRPGPRLPMRIRGMLGVGHLFLRRTPLNPRAPMPLGVFVAGVTFLSCVLDESTQVEIRTSRYRSVALATRTSAAADHWALSEQSLPLLIWV